jgi:hypothetical protein
MSNPISRRGLLGGLLAAAAALLTRSPEASAAPPAPPAPPPPPPPAAPPAEVLQARICHYDAFGRLVRIDDGPTVTLPDTYDRFTDLRPPRQPPKAGPTA